jgi:hypothetical protein
MVTRARGRFINRPTKTGRGVYDKFFVYVPTELARDSSFPFKAGEEVDIQIAAGKATLIVQLKEGKKIEKEAKRSR